MNRAEQLFNECKDVFNNTEFYKGMSKEKAIEACKKLQSLSVHIPRILTITIINYDLNKTKECID